MKRWLNVILQSSGFVAQVILPTFVFNPQSEAIAYGTTAAVVAAVQAIAGVVAHSYNPDGTVAAIAYRPK